MASCCVRCGGPVPTARHSYCDLCRPPTARYRERRRNRLRARQSNAARGYGYEHKQLRKRIARLVAAGLAVCWRCGLPIGASEPWDLGHDDEDRSIYRGPEHRACNRSTAGRKRARMSRRW